MDALSLVLPAATIANPGSNGADAGTADAAGGTATVDFAALLAAGLMPQAQLAGVLPVPPAAAQATDQAPEDGAGAASSDAGAAPLAGALQNMLHPGVMTQASHGSGNGPSAASPHALGATPSVAPANGKPGADVAAEAATIAVSKENALPAGAEHDTHALERSGSNEAVHGTTAEASASLGQLLHLGAAEKTASAHAASAMLEVATPVNAPDFGQALSQQVVWMANKDAQVAELRINPPELGPVEVRLHISGDEAAVQFTSAHAEVRGAIEAALARLRESMAQAGIQLGEASVSAESFRDQAARHSGDGESRGGYRNEAARAEPAWTPTSISGGVRRGLVDLFA